jgi:hypothetical protein
MGGIHSEYGPESKTGSQWTVYVSCRCDSTWIASVSHGSPAYLANVHWTIDLLRLRLVLLQASGEKILGGYSQYHKPVELNPGLLIYRSLS